MSETSLELITSAPVVVIWMAAIGACIGSFLNVVVYRLPAGKSIVYPGSHCPHCEHPIRGYDNIPMVSWLVLRGRCRDCRTPISLRYPLVEATVALLFALICAKQILTSGENLPSPSGATTSLDGPESWILGAYHLCLLSTLLCVALVEWDGKRTPLLLIGPIAMIGLVAPAWFPFLKPVTVTGLLVADSASGPATALGAGLVGGAAGILLGLLAWPAAAGPAPSGMGPRGPILAAQMVGAFLGWQAIMVIAWVATALHATVARPLDVARPGARVPWSAWLAATTLAYLLVWGSVAERRPYLVTAADLMTLTIACLITSGLSALAWILWRPTDAAKGA